MQQNEKVIELLNETLTALNTIVRKPYNYKGEKTHTYDLALKVGRMITQLELAKKAAQEESNPDVIKALDISTAHIRPSTDKFLGDPTYSTCPLPLRVAAHEYGYVLFLRSAEAHAEHLKENRYEGYDDIRDIVTYALANGYKMVNLDRDGRENDKLPQYEWD